MSATEAAFYLGVSVAEIHQMIKSETVRAVRSTSGQYRLDIKDLHQFNREQISAENEVSEKTIEKNNSLQKLICGDSRVMKEISDESIHLAVTSPPYFNAKMYSHDLDGDLGNVHDMNEWLVEIEKVWREVMRVLQPGRKFFLNIMNLPIRDQASFRTLNLVGKNIDICESIGFIFKRDIVWHKTNGVRAHFGTYPYPGGILINNMHEFIIEFEKPAKKGAKKYAHLTSEQKEQSKLDKDFWLSLKNSDVWKMKPEASGSRRQHIAPFPVEMPMRVIRAYSYVGETVLDPFLGSASTMIAAMEGQRHAVGYEINPSIFFDACRRLENWQERLI